ncbi:hypothetical protein TSTA_028090 [Talaromyces stipitatus ATCC 10500]|uniref:Uncharacterized protein n=1 Tax=Talaromyces stipitatus (strain ATCC 10500 / CBS 375.48 / QM 6759 / NRRL 1006) TaxID=441959 RepID=B8M6Q6_TALSN|nr:uncharacterized protein TSTA_028090 [Talaromyces stipitatus ATCC 10500]EED19518.1 hypothetical protein TSTA_028090 [Talaromyces stipitatus ATCC 10500]
MAETRSKKKLAEAQDSRGNTKRAQKGDCHILADKLASTRKRMLVYGGVTGTWRWLRNVLENKISPISMRFNVLTMIRTILQVSFLLSHRPHGISPAHSAGLIDMSNDTPPTIDNFLFNDPSGRIATFLPGLNFPAPPVHTLGRLKISPTTTAPEASSELVEGFGPLPPAVRWIPDSKRQGQIVWSQLWNSKNFNQQPPMEPLAPWGNPGAIAYPNVDEFPLFPTLNTTFYGPSMQIIENMRSRGSRGIQVDRASIITVFSTKDKTDGFSALFTGDAHDTEINRDIRGNRPFLSIFPS